jgi:hypothetical protein
MARGIRRSAKRNELLLAFHDQLTNSPLNAFTCGKRLLRPRGEGDWDYVFVSASVAPLALTKPAL